MADLRDIPEIYPHTVRVAHRGEPLKVALACVKWLEGHEIMNIVDFHLEVNYEEEKIGLLFKRKKHAKIFKSVKKAVRHDALQG